MAEPPPYPDTDDDADVGPDLGPAPSTPRWVKVFGIAFLVLVLLIAIMMAHGIMAGGHGPFDRHMVGGGLGGHTPPSSVTATGVHQP